MARLDQMRSVLGRCTPPEHLRGQVLDQVRTMRAGQREDTIRGAHAALSGKVKDGRDGRRGGAFGHAVAVAPGGAAVSRRGFVIAGAAACLGVGAVGVGLASRMRGGAGSGGAPGASGAAAAGTDAGALAANPFGLAVAYADEGGEPAEPGSPVALEARLDGLLPIGDTTGWYMTLKLNLACVGEGIETVTYSLAGDAARVTDGSEPSPVPDPLLGTYVYDSYEQELQEKGVNQTGGTVQFGTMGDPRIRGTEQGMRVDDWLSARTAERLEAGLDPLEMFSFTVDYADEPGWDGTFATEWGEAYRVLRVTFQDAFWACDEVVAAKRAWLDASAKGGETSEELQANQEAARAARAAYEELFCEVAATEESLYAWLQSVNRTCFGLAAEMLAQVTLGVDATFADGSTAHRDYRIEPVENLDEVADGRFAALVERYGLGEEAYDPSLAPFWNFSDYVPEPDEPDERLTRALFSIADVTEA